MGIFMILDLFLLSSLLPDLFYQEIHVLVYLFVYLLALLTGLSVDKEIDIDEFMIPKYRRVYILNQIYEYSDAYFCLFVVNEGKNLGWTGVGLHRSPSSRRSVYVNLLVSQRYTHPCAFK